MSGAVLVRCPSCRELEYDPRDEACEACSYSARCNECGTPIDPELYDPETPGFCTPYCHGRGLDAEWAELSLDR